MRLSKFLALLILGLSMSQPKARGAELPGCASRYSGNHFINYSTVKSGEKRAINLAFTKTHLLVGKSDGEAVHPEDRAQWTERTYELREMGVGFQIFSKEGYPLLGYNPGFTSSPAGEFYKCSGDNSSAVLGCSREVHEDEILLSEIDQNSLTDEDRNLMSCAVKTLSVFEAGLTP